MNLKTIHRSKLIVFHSVAHKLNLALASNLLNFELFYRFSELRKILMSFHVSIPQVIRDVERLLHLKIYIPIYKTISPD